MHRSVRFSITVVRTEGHLLIKKSFKVGTFYSYSFLQESYVVLGFLCRVKIRSKY